MARTSTTTTGKQARTEGELGARLRRRRKALDLTAKDLARIAGVSPSYISQLEHGKQDHPSLEVLGALAQALGLPMTELLAGSTAVATTGLVDVPPALGSLAQELGLDGATVQMLAAISVGGYRPSTRDGWLLIYLAIQHACRTGPAAKVERVDALGLEPVPAG